MKLMAVAIVMALVLTVSIAGVSCGGGPDREAIAAEVATEWAQDSIEVVSEIVVELLSVSPALKDTLGRMPNSKGLLAGLVADQVRDKIAWSYSAPVQDREELYQVTATAAAELEIDLPIIGEHAYAVTLPFLLLIDTDARTVEEWAVDLEEAVVAGY